MRTLIVGGGLSGLALAEMMEARRQDYLLVEARDRFGGRIKTEHYAGGYFDMGPAWFWPGQPRIATLIDRLGLKSFDQFAQGELMFEDEQGRIQRGRVFSSMQGSWRLKGGLAALTQGLADKLPESRKYLNSSVATLEHGKEGITASFANGGTVVADQAVLCLPPRIAAEINFLPALPDVTKTSMLAVSTWMAGQAKAIAVYDEPFWRDAGLSGDAMSRLGPIVEIHDASPAEGGPFALFGFIGVPPEAREDEGELHQHLLNQLERIFGARAANPLKLIVKDWAFDPFTATAADHAPLYAHPTYGLPQALAGLWDGKLQFGGTEVAPQFGGYIEGALEAAENVLGILERNNSDQAYVE